MSKVFANIVALGLVAVPVIAHAETSAPVSFKHAGVLYTYTVEQLGNRKVLRGVAGTSREPFVLEVGKNWVDGTVGGSPVSFSMRSVRRVNGIVAVEQMAVR